MRLLSKKAIRGSIVIEASIAVPVMIIAFFLTITYFNILHTEIRFERCIHAAAGELMLDYSDYSIFNGIVENAIKKEILQNRFSDQLKEEITFREIESKVVDITVDLSDLFNYGENEGYLRYGYRISLVRFSGKIYLKAIGEGIRREEDWDGIWSLDPWLRGKIIAKKLGGNMEEFFELITRFRDGEACVIKSLNPDLESYAAAGSIYQEIYPAVERLAAYNGYIDGQAVMTKKLIFVVPGDPKNVFLAGEIQRLEGECERCGIAFECIRYGFLYR
jgi:hypothetical protein